MNFKTLLGCIALASPLLLGACSDKPANGDYYSQHPKKWLLDNLICSTQQYTLDKPPSAKCLAVWNNAPAKFTQAK